jgi:hypothetical protein
LLLALCGEAENPKFEAPAYAPPLRRGRRNPKWFDRLTTLSHVEGQYPMTKIQMTKTASLWVPVLNIGSLVH